MAEVETTVTFGKMPDYVSVWTNDPKWVRRIKRVGVEPTQVGKRVEEPDSYWFEVPIEKFVMRFRHGKAKRSGRLFVGRAPA